MEKKDLNFKQYSNLIFRCTNLTELRDESIYGQLKLDTQREYLLIVFLYNLINTYLDYYWNGNLCDEALKIIYLNKINFYTTNELFFTEMSEFKKFIELPINKNKIEKLKQIIKCQEIMRLKPLEMFYNLFNLYDEEFNSKIILEKLCGIKLTLEQFYSIIIYFFDKTNYLQNMLEPAHNSRSIIIKNYYEPHDPFNIKGTGLSLKNSKKNDYNYELRDGKFTYDFDIKFKETILLENWSDGYDFWWNESDKNDNKKDKNNCLKYFVEILDPYNKQIISMTITKNTKISNEQIHFYIKKNLITQIKSFINNDIEYKNISLLIHSYAAWIFDANTIYSNLLLSMRIIFEKNNILVNILSNNNFLKFAEFCIREVSHEIQITADFKKLWFNEYNYQELTKNSLIKIHKLGLKTNNFNSSIDKLNKIPTETINKYDKFLVTNRSKFFFILFICILLGMITNNIFNKKIAYSLLISTLAIIIIEYINNQNNNLKEHINPKGQSNLTGGMSPAIYLLSEILISLKNEYIRQNQQYNIKNEPVQSIITNSFLIPIIGEKNTRIFYKLFTISISSYILPHYVHFFKNIFGFNNNKEEIKKNREIFNDKYTGGIAKIFMPFIGIGFPLFFIHSIIDLFKLIFSSSMIGGNINIDTKINNKTNTNTNTNTNTSILSWLYSLISNISNIEKDITNEIKSMFNISSNEISSSNEITLNNEILLEDNEKSNIDINNSKLYQDYNKLKLNIPNKLSNKSDQIIINKIISLEKLKEEINNIYDLIVNSSKAISLGLYKYQNLDGLTENTMKILVEEYKKKIKIENKQTDKINKIFNKITII